MKKGIISQESMPNQKTEEYHTYLYNPTLTAAWTSKYKGEQLPQASAVLYYYFEVLGKGSKPNKLLLYVIW